MFLLLAIILIVAWLLGFFVINITAPLFHLILIVAVAMLIYHIFWHRDRV